MKSPIKIINLFILNFLLVFFLFFAMFLHLPNNALAQGWYTCKTTDDGTNCVDDYINCDTGYEHQCYGKNVNYCDGSYQFTCSPLIPTSAQGIDKLYPEIQKKSGLFTMNRFTDLSDIVNAFIQIIFPIVGLLLLLYLLYGGYNLMLSGGDPKKAAAAKSIITTAFLGFIIIFFSYWLVKIVGKVLGLQAFEDIFGP